MENATITVVTQGLAARIEWREGTWDTSSRVVEVTVMTVDGHTLSSALLTLTQLSCEVVCPAPGWHTGVASC